jgi:hypothetical protein
MDPAYEVIASAMRFWSFRARSSACRTSAGCGTCGVPRRVLDPIGPSCALDARAGDVEAPPARERPSRSVTAAGARFAFVIVIVLTPPGAIPP